jgi:hypothetical protein
LQLIGGEEPLLGQEIQALDELHGPAEREHVAGRSRNPVPG